MRGAGQCAVTADQFKNRKAAFVANDRLAIDQARPHRQLSHGHRYKGKARRKIVSGAGNQPHARTIAAGQDAEAVMLDFVNPAGAGRRRLRWRWQTRLDYPQTRAGTLTQRHSALLIGTEMQRVESRLGGNKSQSIVTKLKPKSSAGIGI